MLRKDVQFGKCRMIICLGSRSRYPIVANKTGLLRNYSGRFYVAWTNAALQRLQSPLICAQGPDFALDFEHGQRLAER